MIEGFLKRLAKALDHRRIPYMIIGGQAVLIHGRPRLTQDVDVTLGVDTDSLDEVMACCQQLTLELLPEAPQQFAQERKVLPARDRQSGMQVDFIFSSTPYERQAIARAMTVPIDGYPVRYASVEDLVIHKVFAGRAIDEEDARTVIVKHGDRLDQTYIRRWLKILQEVVEEGRDLMAVWQRLSKRSRGS